MGQKVLILVLISVLVSCSQQSPNASNSQASTENSSVVSSNTVGIPLRTPVATPIGDFEAIKEKDKRINSVFERCSNGMTYVVEGHHVIEIEKFDSRVESYKGTPDPIDLRNDITWKGSILVQSTASRSYDILNECWSKYNSGLNGSFSLTYEAGVWLPPTTFPNYIRPSCNEIIPYLSKAKVCK